MEPIDAVNSYARSQYLILENEVHSRPCRPGSRLVVEAKDADLSLVTSTPPSAAQSRYPGEMCRTERIRAPEPERSLAS